MSFTKEKIMNEHMLTNYGIIRSFHDQGKSVIDTLLPLVEYGVAEIIKDEKAHYDKSSLKNLIFTHTGVKIHDITLTNLLKKLEKKGVLRLFSKNQYFQILAEKKLDVQKYLSSIQSSERKLNKFIGAYRQFSGDAQDVETIKKFIYDFIRYNSINNCTLGEDQLGLIKFEPLFEFIKYIYYQEDELVKIFEDINFGYRLCSLVEKEEQIEKIKLKDFVIFLDSNFILRLLDLQEECFSDETKELFELLSKSGAKLKIFQETINEVISVIEYYKQKYAREKNTIVDFVEASRINGVYGAFYRRALEITQIDNIVENLQRNIENFGITIDNIERYNLSPNEAEVVSLYERKYGETDQKDKDYRYTKCKNYISIIEIIKWNRKTREIYAKSFAESKYIFLTCDWKVYRHNLNGRNIKVSYPEIIIQEAIVDNLMLFFPESYGKIAVDLLVSVYQSSQYLNVHDLASFERNIKSIIEEDPSMSSYVLKAMKNIENYDEISQLYQQDEQEAIEGLKQIVELQKQKDEKEKERLEQERQKEITEKIAIAEAAGIESGKQAGYNEGKQRGFTEGKELGIEEGKTAGRREGELAVYRKIAKQRAKLFSILKSVLFIIIFLGSATLSVLILTNIIDVSKWNLNETAKWVTGLLITALFWSGGGIGAKFIKIDEESIYNKLVAKNYKDKE